jgi:hypothetical protein
LIASFLTKNKLTKRKRKGKRKMERKRKGKPERRRRGRRWRTGRFTPSRFVLGWETEML